MKECEVPLCKPFTMGTRERKQAKHKLGQLELQEGGDLVDGGDWIYLISVVRPQPDREVE